MCGLTGILYTSPRGNDEIRDTVEAMTRTLMHRGPDAQGTWIGEGIALGHRRLAIVELSAAGAQPMLSASGKYVIVFNGEIYNHLELRAALESDGCTPNWRGLSDTETLLAAIERWGLEKALQRSYGMFALALWDISSRRLQLARDRFGEKPLYWGWAGGDFVFSSELKAFKAHQRFSPTICKQALGQYLRFSYVPAPASIFEGIYKLEPACILDIQGKPPAQRPSYPLRPGQKHDTLSIRKYWSLTEDFEEGLRQPFSDEREALSVLTAKLEASVSRQMQSDVALGAFLSGGIDSSLIVALMQKQSSRPIRTYTVGFENEAFNEAPFANSIAQHLGTDHTEVVVAEAEARQVIPLLPHIYDEPFADSSQIPTYLVCRTARSGVTVALSGDAGDELFGGYNRYIWGPRVWRTINRLPFKVRKAIGSGILAMPMSAWDQIGEACARVGFLSVARPGEKAYKLATRLSNSRTMDEFYGSLVTEWGSDAPPITYSLGAAISSLDDCIPGAFDGDIAGRMMVQDLRTYLPDDILCKVDRAAMATSLETRVPFLDPEVFTAATKLPQHMKVRDGQGKWALRQILYKHVPQDLIERPKTGFGVPLGEWLRGPLREWAEDLLSPPQLARDGLLDPERIRKTWSEHLSGRRDWSSRLWIVLMFQAWRYAQ